MQYAEGIVLDRSMRLRQRVHSKKQPHAPGQHRCQPGPATSACSCMPARCTCVCVQEGHAMLDMPVAIGGAFQRDQRNASQTCGASRRLATPRNASQHLATRLQHASRALDTLNGRSATRRPEKETNQMHCTEDIVLDMRLRQSTMAWRQRGRAPRLLVH